jgi:ion channel
MPRFSGLRLLFSLLALFVAHPFLSHGGKGELILTLLLSLVLTSVLLAIGGGRRVLFKGLALLVPAIVSRWLPHVSAIAQDNALAVGCMSAFVGFVVWRALKFVLQAPRVDRDVLSAGVSVYLLAGLLWAFLYLLVAKLIPGSFAFSGGPSAGAGLSQSDALYFSFSTLTTAGYGDITPVSQPARMLANLEAIAGVLYLAVLVGRLVSLYSAEPKAE